MNKMNRSRKLNFVGLGVLLALSLSSARGVCQQAIPANTLGWSAKIDLGDQSSGSGFYLQSENYVFVVTAKHVLFNNVMQNGKATVVLRSNTATVTAYVKDASEDKPEIMSLDLVQLMKDGNVRAHESQDVAVIRVLKIQGFVPSDPNVKVDTSLLDGVKSLQTIKSGLIRIVSSDIKLLKDVFVGNDVLLFGYPSSLGLIQEPQIDFHRPLLRKGMVAAINPQAKSIIIDCPSYFGNSGGPVMEIDRMGMGFTIQIIGLVVSYVPFVQQASSNTLGISLLTNSGYSVVVPMDFVLELIK